MIENKCALFCGYGELILESLRCIRSEAVNPLFDIQKPYNYTVSIALSFSLSRYKLRKLTFKADSSIIQAITLLTDLTLQCNLYGLKLSRWYDWYFPELNNVILDNLCSTNTLRKLTKREEHSVVDTFDMLSTRTKQIMEEAKFISLKRGITDDDLDFAKQLCEQVLELSRYQILLKQYLKQQMTLVAPNLA